MGNKILGGKEMKWVWLLKARDTSWIFRLYDFYINYWLELTLIIVIVIINYSLIITIIIVILIINY